MLTLYYAPGACSLAPHIVLQELGLEHRLERVVTALDEQRRPEFLELNPLGRVPVLCLERGRRLTEVAAILQYLSDLAPERGLMPTDRVARARARELLSVIGTSMHPAYTMVIRPDRVVPDGAAHTAMRDAGRRRFADLLRHVETTLPAEAWTLGSSYSICDPYLFVMVLWARYADVDLSDLPKITSFAGQMIARPAVARALVAEGLMDGDGRPTPPSRV